MTTAPTSAAPWYGEAVHRFLAARCGGEPALDRAEVDWDQRAVCRATLPGGDRVLVKIDRDRVRHDRELAGLRAAAAAHAPVPRVRWDGQDEHRSQELFLLVLDEVPTRRSMADPHGPWTTAGAAVRALHAAPIPPGMAMFCDGVGAWNEHLEHRIAVECAAAVQRRLIDQADADAVRRYAARTLALAGPAPRILLHGDLQARHLLVDGERVVLVDFGDAGWGDPALDLVVLTHFTPERRAEVLDGYRADQALRERVALLAPLYSLWRNLFVSRWYFENDFEQQRNSQSAREVVATVVRPANQARTLTMDFSAALVDFDGLLVDTEFAGWRSWNELYSRYDRSLPIEAWARRCGSNEPLTPWTELEAAAGTPLDTQAMEQRRRQRRDSLMTVLPGVHRFLARCRAEGVALAVVSNSPRHWITRQMDLLGLDPGLFDLIVPGDGRSPKPAPDGYLHALAELGLPAEEAVAFEDSARGVAAAQAAGLRCVAVPNRVTVHDDLSRADQIVATIDEVTPRSRTGARP
jgi:HAD superfamily hydrolase (TIGR01509 family)